MSDLPQISEAEFEVMKIVWKPAYIENDRLSETEIDALRSLLSKRSKKGGN